MRCIAFMRYSPYRVYGRAAALSGAAFGRGQELKASAASGFGSMMALLLLAAACVLILKNFGFRGAPLVAAVVSVSALSSYESAFSEIFGVFGYLAEVSEAGEYVAAALKVVGISYLSGISCDVCREIGESGIARTVSLITRLEVILVCLPYVKEILSSLVSLTEQ